MPLVYVASSRTASSIKKREERGREEPLSEEDGAMKTGSEEPDQ